MVSRFPTREAAQEAARDGVRLTGKSYSVLRYKSRFWRWWMELPYMAVPALLAPTFPDYEIVATFEARGR